MMTEQQAIAYHASGAWKDLPLVELARLQLSEDCLCVPFDKFHEAVEKSLDRPVYTHEFADRERIASQFVAIHGPLTHNT